VTLKPEQDHTNPTNYRPIHSESHYVSQLSLENYGMCYYYPFGLVLRKKWIHKVVFAAQWNIWSTGILKSFY
jgi:hypothetical protein